MMRNVKSPPSTPKFLAEVYREGLECHISPAYCDIRVSAVARGGCPGDPEALARQEIDRPQDKKFATTFQFIEAT